MADQYLVLNMIKVDRGIINVGTPSQGKHIPYYAGLVIQNQRSFNLEYLDEFNSEILLRKVLGCPEYSNPSLREITQTYHGFFQDCMSVTIVKDLDEYLKANKIKRAPRNAPRMKQMAERINKPPF